MTTLTEYLIVYTDLDDQEAYFTAKNKRLVIGSLKIILDNNLNKGAGGKILILPKGYKV